MSSQPTPEECRSCPFCGHRPHTEHYQDGDWEIACLADTCPANPGVYGKTKQYAVQMWNLRLGETDIVYLKEAKEF